MCNDSTSHPGNHHNEHTSDGAEAKAKAASIEPSATQNATTPFPRLASFPKCGVSLWETETNLLSKLAGSLLAFEGNNLHEHIVILPTQRLGTALLALLAQEKTAFRPPKITTLDSFIQTQGRLQDNSSTHEAAPDIVQEFILGSIIEEQNYRHIRAGNEHEIKQFFTDLSESGVGIHGFEKLKAVIQQDVFHSENHVSSLIERFDEMENLHRKFFAILAKKNHTNSANALAARTAYLFHKWRDASRMDWRWVHIACFTTAKPYARPLLGMLAAKQNVSLYVSRSPKLFGSIQPLKELSTKLLAWEADALTVGFKTCASAGENHFDSEPVEAQPPELLLNSEQHRPKASEIHAVTRVHACKNILSETAEALQLAETYIAKGYTPSTVAILVANENLHGKPLRSMIQKSNREANLAIGLTMAQTMFGTWMSLLSDLILSDEDAGAILAFATHPLTISWLIEQNNSPLTQVDMREGDNSQDMNTKDAISISLALKASFGVEICSQKEFSGFKKIATNCSSPLVQKSLNCIQKSIQNFSSETSPLRQCRSLSSWMKSLEQVFDCYQVFTRKSLKDAGILSSVRTSAICFFKEVMESTSFVDPNLSRTQFLSLIKEKFLALDVRNVGYPLKGLQILSIIEARYVPFKVAIVLGCTEGNFPKALPADNLVDDWLKSKIGLPGWKYVEALEDTTFHLMLARLPQLELFYSEDEKGEPTVRSRFIENLLCQGAAEHITHSSDNAISKYFTNKEYQKTEQLNISHTNQTRSASTPTCSTPLLEDDGTQHHQPSAKLGVFQHQRDHFVQTMSATSLQKFLTCPYKFLFSKLKISGLPLPSENRAIIEGEWLHEILESFYTSKRNGQRVIDDLNESMDDKDRASYSMNRLTDISKIVIPLTEHKTPFFEHLLRFSWPKFSEHYSALVRSGQRKTSITKYREFQIGDSQGQSPCQLTITGRKILIRGSIDSIDDFEQGYILTDYKRNTTTPAKEVDDGISPQLSLYAKAIDQLAHSQDSRPIANGVLGYWSILRGEWKPIGVGASAKPWAIEHGFASKSSLNSEDLFEHMNQIWTWRTETLINGKKDFSPDPSEKKWCLYCDFVNICRKDDPEYRDQVRNGAELETKIYLRRKADKQKANKQKADAKTSAKKKASTTRTKNP